MGCMCEHALASAFCGACNSLRRMLIFSHDESKQVTHCWSGFFCTCGSPANVLNRECSFSGARLDWNGLVWIRILSWGNLQFVICFIYRPASPRAFIEESRLKA